LLLALVLMGSTAAAEPNATGSSEAADGEHGELGELAGKLNNPVD